MRYPSVLESPADLTQAQIEHLLSVAKSFKSISTPGTANGRRSVATLFLEPSTRTKISFALAADKLGHYTVDVDPGKSSFKKGEGLEETLVTLGQQGIELCTIRTDVTGQLTPFKNNPPIKLINGGDGSGHHPTQALLDLFTLREMGINFEDGKAPIRLAIVGDIAHSRVAHSLMELLPLFGIELLLCGPPAFLPKDGQHPVSDDLDEALEKADILYLLRVQKERHGDSLKGQQKGLQVDYNSTYGITMERLSGLKSVPPILHPGPANLGVEIDREVWESPHFKGGEQVVNSVYMRMGIISAMLGDE